MISKYAMARYLCLKSKENLLWFFCNILILFLFATKTAALVVFVSFRTQLQGKRNYPNTDRGSDSKVHFVLTHAGLFVLTCVCLHILVSNLLEWLHDVVSASEYFYDFGFYS